MSALRSAFEELAGEDLGGVKVDQLADDLVELELVSGLLETERVRRLALYGSKGGPARHGYPSLTSFLKDRCGMAAGRAHRLVATANVIRRALATFRAWVDARISTDQAYRLFEVAETLPDEFAEVEDTLIGAVEGLSVSDTKRALDYWRQSVDGPGTIADEIRQHDLRGVSLSRTMGGMTRLDGWLTTSAGQALQSALAALMPPPSPTGERSPRQRRHDAIEDLALQSLDHGGTPDVGGEKPHINLVCDLPALQGVAGGLHETESGSVITVDTCRKLACDSSISRIVLGPNSEVVDVGRRTRVIPPAIRRAVIARDRHCTWPGCDRDPRWCDAHHIIHWADGGETKPVNLKLLCRYHHTLTHRRVPPRGPPGSDESHRLTFVTLRAAP